MTGSPDAIGTRPATAARGLAGSAGAAADAAGADARAREIDTAARAFEKLLVQRMLGDMRRAARGGEAPANAMANWESMFDEEIAEVVTRGGGLGFGDALSRSLGGSGSVGVVQGGARAEGLPAGDVRALRRLADGAREAGDTAGRAAAAAPVVRPAAGLPMREAPLPAVPEAPRPDAAAARAERQSDFLSPLLVHAERGARRIGTAPEAILAVAALETGWGRHRIVGADGADSHNLFGIKATGASRADAVTTRTTEFVGGAARSVEADFRRFESPADAIDGFADFVLDNPRYAPALAVADDPEAFLRALHGAGYATDPDYADKVVGVMRRVRERLDGGDDAAAGAAARNALPTPHRASPAPRAPAPPPTELPS